MSTPMFSVGLDVHKDSVTIAVFRDRDREPMRVDRLPNDHKKLRRYFERLGAEGSVRACYVGLGCRLCAAARARELGRALRARCSVAHAHAAR